MPDKQTMCFSNCYHLSQLPMPYTLWASLILYIQSHLQQFPPFEERVYFGLWYEGIWNLMERKAWQEERYVTGSPALQSGSG